MPTPKHPVYAILRDEAKNLLGRTPAQIWFRPDRVEVSIRRATLPDPITAQGDKSYVEDAELEFVLDSPRTRFPQQANLVRPSPDLFDQFLRLEEASPEKIQKFASRFGALLVFCRIGNQKLPRGKIVVFESCAVWKYFAAAMLSLLRIASCFHSDRRPDPADWDRIGVFPASMAPPAKEDFRDLLGASLGGEEAWTAMAYFVGRGSDRDRKMWTRFLNALLELGRVRPWLIWEGAKGLAQPKLVFSGANLLSYLALQLCLRASRHDAFAVCSYCGRQYAPTLRAPKAGQRNFCPDCRAGGAPVRVAQRSRRERLRGENSVVD